MNTLPEGYKEIFYVDLKNNRQALIVNGISLLIFVIAFWAGSFVTPLTIIIDNNIFTVLILEFACLAAYIAGHELIHGVLIKKYSGKKASYGFAGLYFFAGSHDALFKKRDYIIIALAPVLVFGVLFLALNIFLPVKLFWFVYILQLMNISGAAGDIYITAKMLTFPRDLLVLDRGTTMTVYAKDAQ